MNDSQLGARFARHGFATRPTDDVVSAVRGAVAIQAQDLAAARLGVRARARGVTDGDVRRAIDDDRTLVRTWLMRNTIHLVPAADLRWMTAQLGPMIARRFGSVRWPQLGLVPQLLDHAALFTPDALENGPLTRHELVDALRIRGVPLPIDEQTATHLVVYLSTIGLVCHATDRGRESTFALVEQWLPNAPAGPQGEDGLAELGRRYFATFSPAVPADFTAWSGLPSSRAIQLIRDELTPVDVGGRAGFQLGEVAPESGVRLLPAFENYLIGYRHRAPMIAPDRRADVYLGGVIRPTVVSDGRVIGRWRITPRRHPEAPIWLFDSPRPERNAVTEAVAEEVADIGRFLALDLVAIRSGD